MILGGVEAQWQLVRSSDVDMHASKSAVTRRGEERKNDEEGLLTESRVLWKSATLTTVVASADDSAGVLRAIAEYERWAWVWVKCYDVLGGGEALEVELVWWLGGFGEEERTGRSFAGGPCLRLQTLRLASLPPLF
jgi:hypothetical protein